ncbi:hypothetical protein NOVO_09275 (plasmid) [Rickettsiales bacterium Ac37b]|nr:hypothetical protein NOVO_09275 [Rickettsiales bacterium Ac37b]
MSACLTNESSIIFLPNLAKVIGTNESLILSLIHYWINPKYNQNFKSDRYWVYNSYEQWQKKLPNLSLITIRRAINKLEKMGVLVSDKLSNNPYLKVKWYSIDYDALYKLIPSELVPHKSAMSSNIRVDKNDHHNPELGKKFTCDQNEQGGDQIDQIICNATNTTTNNKNSLLVTKAKEVIKSEVQDLERERC